MTKRGTFLIKTQILEDDHLICPTQTAEDSYNGINFPTEVKCGSDLPHHLYRNRFGRDHSAAGMGEGDTVQMCEDCCHLKNVNLSFQVLLGKYLQASPAI